MEDLNISKLTSRLEENPSWISLCYNIRNNKIPGSTGVNLPLAFHDQIAMKIAHLMLCDHGNSCENCASCQAWLDDFHPDLHILGSPDDIPGAESIREGCKTIALSPVTAPVKLLVVHNADRLTPAAANSLLKTAEEPPAHGRLLMLTSGENILPTLRSRLWMIAVPLSEIVTPTEPPKTDDQWLRFFSDNAKAGGKEMFMLTQSFAAWLSSQGKYKEAANLQTFAKSAQNTHLSASMWADVLFLTIREEFSLEYVFDDLWQAKVFGQSHFRGDRPSKGR